MFLCFKFCKDFVLYNSKSFFFHIVFLNPIHVVLYMDPGVSFNHCLIFHQMNILYFNGPFLQWIFAMHFACPALEATSACGGLCTLYVFGASRDSLLELAPWLTLPLGHGPPLTSLRPSCVSTADLDC